MTKCNECNWTYPDSLITEFVSNNGTTYCCGICALEMSNKIHAVNNIPPREKFDGPIAEHMRQLAIIWRKKNPNHAPVTEE